MASVALGDGIGDAVVMAPLRTVSAPVLVDVDDGREPTFRLDDRDGPDEVDPTLPDFA